ncbi:hypothetical protein BHM03_00000849 [Ensete ventricosum]|nr:hypothetical protein BHM03_00000849 [Ensete ventricosum]
MASPPPPLRPTPPPPPPPPPSLRPLKHLPPTSELLPGSTSTTTTSSSSSVSLSPSLLIISAIIAFVFVASASIHLLLRFLSSRRRSSSVSAAPPAPPLLQPRRPESSFSSSSAAAATAAASNSGLSDKDKKALIDALPLFSLASSLAAVPKSSLDCAVCLYPFRPHDELRLLPACRHAFHSRCVDPWLRSTPSCPLCRASIALRAAPLLPPPTAAPPTVASHGNPSRSGSFRVEIGSVSRRSTPPEAEPVVNDPPHLRTYSLGSSFEYVIDEEVEAVVARIRRTTDKEEKRDAVAEPAAVIVAGPALSVADVAGGGGRGWLREYVDRLASSASSSFSSFRFSGRWSHDGGGGAARYSYDLEGSARREAEEGGYYGFYRWLIGA